MFAHEIGAATALPHRPLSLGPPLASLVPYSAQHTLPTVHCGHERAARSMHRGPGPWNFLLENKSRNYIFLAHLQFGLWACCKSTRSPYVPGDLSVGPLVSKMYIWLGPKPLETLKKSSKIPEKGPQMLQEPLFFHAKALQPLKIPQIPLEPPKMTVQPFKASKSHIFLYRALFSRSCAQILRIHHSFYSCIHT
jgi:hypothetical protein